MGIIFVFNIGCKRQVKLLRSGQAYGIFEYLLGWNERKKIKAAMIIFLLLINKTKFAFTFLKFPIRNIRSFSLLFFKHRNIYEYKN